ncbi:MAG: response regulator [Lachnospiraceae bacterium]|nr:response regulator [Lachnospiraceae bacterium]
MKNDGSAKKKKLTIFRFFLISLIAIMLIQSAITIGTLVVRRTAKTLEDYSGGMMRRLVENRQVILQNDMVQRWSSVSDQEGFLNNRLQQFLTDEDVELEEVLRSDERKDRLLEQLFPECLSVLQNSSTTGIFLALTGADMETAGDYAGFFIRDSDPHTNPVNYTDLLLERGSKQLSRAWNVPLDTNWTTRFHMDGMGRNSRDAFFYEPWRAGEQYPDADVEDLGYWSLPFALGKKSSDTYEMITYSLPLRYDGRVYGVLGVEISCRSLYDYFPAAELNTSQQSGYMLAVRGKDGTYTSLTGKGMLYDLVRSADRNFTLQETVYDNLSLVQDIKLTGQGVYAVECPLELYGKNVPYENTDWVLLGLNTEKELFGMSRQLYFWMVIAVLIGLIFGVFGIYILVRHLTRPVQHLMQCIMEGSAGLKRFKPSNILEIDALYEVISDLTEQQKQAENILLEEKERYKVALESSKDIFFSYDVQNHSLDLVNHNTMNGQWQCHGSENGYINLDYIYEPDREGVQAAIQQDPDNPYAEFRLRWPGEAEFNWVALTGKAVYDTDGRRWKLMGSIRNIQEQKEREAEQLRKNMTDDVTGLYVFSAGMEFLSQARRKQPEGVMANLFLHNLKDMNEKNGVVFGDMILETIGGMILEKCRILREEAGCPAIALRLNQDEFVVWLEGLTQEDAARQIKDLLDHAAACYDEEVFHIRLCAGLCCGKTEQSAEELIRRAKLARSLALPSAGKRLSFYEEISRDAMTVLPALQGQEINSLGYDKNTGLVSVALNLFGRGSDFPAQMMLLLQKIGRFYQASDVLVSMLRTDFNSNYLNYQWHQDHKEAAPSVRKYSESEKNAFYDWLGQAEVRHFSKGDTIRKELQTFLSVEPGREGMVLPMYDSGNYMGNICILGASPSFLNRPGEYQNLAELGRVIQGQLNQQQHDIASRAKSEFLSRMSHEIRTPMNGIIGMTTIALHKDQTPERILDCLQKIQSSSDYLLGLINDILDMSKIESGKMKLEPFNFNMDEMLSTIRELILPQATAKGIRFIQDIDLTNRWFVGDRMRISQVLINLLGNAVKFTPEGGRITLTIKEASAPNESSSLYFAVKDTGTGIAREEQDRVFRSFEQAANRNPSKQQGTGLGLSISSRLIQLMGSSIQLESALGKGSTFSFTISLAPGEDEQAKSEREEISFEGFHVLVVEDNELNAEIAQCLLEERGFAVDCVYDGSQAVERIRTTEPGTYDVILMDIMMPVMDGLEATRTIRGIERQDCQTIPIIAMSANAFDDDLKESVKCGMNGHLSKPVEVDKLYETLNAVIRSGPG